jgi:hypothetical protein
MVPIHVLTMKDVPMLYVERTFIKKVERKLKYDKVEVKNPLSLSILLRECFNSYETSVREMNNKVKRQFYKNRAYTLAVRFNVVKFADKAGQEEKPLQSKHKFKFTLATTARVSCNPRDKGVMVRCCNVKPSFELSEFVPDAGSPIPADLQ